MPYLIGSHADCPAPKPFAVMKQQDGKLMGCHMTKADAKKQMAALYANEPAMKEKVMENTNENGGLPKENLIRATFPANLELRQEGAAGDMPVMDVQFARYNQWTEINSAFEGNFMERLAPKAFAKTIKENLANMRALFQHGRDPQIGDKVLGPIESIKDTETGPRAKVPLFDTSYNRDLIPGLKAGVYGASFRFKVMREDFNQEPGKSDSNPKGLPERTITEAKVMEFGPVTFPAYEGATAGVRALTLEELSPVLETLPGPEEPGKEPAAEEPAGEEKASELDSTTDRESTISDEEAAPTHPPEVVRRDTQPDTRQTNDEKGVDMSNIDEMRARLDEIEGQLKEITNEFSGRMLDAEHQDRWEALKDEHEGLEEAVKQDTERREYLRSIAKDEKHVERVSVDRHRVNARDTAPDNVFDLTEYHSRAGSQDHLARLYTEGARRALEGFYYPNPSANQEDVNEHVERLLHGDGQDREIAQRIIVMGSPTYRSAFWKSLMKLPLSAAEQSAMVAASMLEARSVLTANTGGVTVPIQIDPTLIPTSNGVLNPFRQIARNVTTTSYLWQGVTQAGVTFTYRAEGATMADNAPTLTARPIQPERADAFIPFSWEVGQDWGSLESELAQAIQDGKDAAEATQFSVGAGHGSNAPQGVLVGAGTVVGTSGATALAVGDVYALEAALPPRYQANASWLMTNATGQKVRQLVAVAGPAQWGDSLAVGQPERLIGHPIYKASTVGTAGATLATTARWGIIGDFSRYVIVDRVGLGIRTIDNLFAGNTTGGLSYPVGMSGVVAFYRNSAGVVDSNAFRVGTIT